MGYTGNRESFHLALLSHRHHRFEHGPGRFQMGYPWRLEDANTAFLAAWESTIFFSTASRATRGMQ